jgi:hypothetical protein
MRKVRVLAARWVVLIGLTVPGTGWAQIATLARQAGWIERAVDREVSRLSLSGLAGDPAIRVARQPRVPKRSWIGRHPALTTPFSMTPMRHSMAWWWEGLVPSPVQSSGR